MSLHLGNCGKKKKSDLKIPKDLGYFFFLHSVNDPDPCDNLHKRTCYFDRKLSYQRCFYNIHCGVIILLRMTQ